MKKSFEKMPEHDQRSEPWRVGSVWSLAVPPRDFRRKCLNTGGLLLSMLTTNAVGAEIGVHEGDFSRRVLEILKPRKMH